MRAGARSRGGTQRIVVLMLWALVSLLDLYQLYEHAVIG